MAISDMVFKKMLGLKAFFTIIASVTDGVFVEGNHMMLKNDVMVQGALGDETIVTEVTRQGLGSMVVF